MKSIVFTGLLFFLSYRSLGQSKNREEILKAIENVKTIKEATAFISDNPGLKIKFDHFDSGTDSTGIYKILMSKGAESLITLNNYLYKIIEVKEVYSLRASYIYLDGTKMSRSGADSLRKVIIAEYKNGASFTDLVKKYNMDGNPNGGDLGWFENGSMAKEFEDAVRKAKTGEIFTLDIPRNDWYYVIKKTFDNKESKEITFLKLPVN